MVWGIALEVASWGGSKEGFIEVRERASFSGEETFAEAEGRAAVGWVSAAD